MTADYSFGRAFLDAFVGREPFSEPDPPASARSWWANFWTALAARGGLDGDAARAVKGHESVSQERSAAWAEQLSVLLDDDNPQIVRAVLLIEPGEALVRRVDNELNEVDRWLNGLHGTLLALHKQNHLLDPSRLDSPFGDWLFSAQFAERGVSARRAEIAHLWDQVLGDAQQVDLESPSVQRQLAGMSSEANLMAAQLSDLVAAASPFFVFVNEFARYDGWPKADDEQRELR